MLIKVQYWVSNNISNWMVDVITKAAEYTYFTSWSYPVTYNSAVTEAEHGYGEADVAAEERNCWFEPED